MIGGATAVGLVAVVTAVLAVDRLSDKRSVLVDRLDPAAVSALRLTTAVITQENAIRGFALGGDEEFLAPFRTGVATRRRATAELQRLVRDDDLGEVRERLAQVVAGVAAWREGFAEPAITQVRAEGPGSVTPAQAAAGDRLFSRLRAALDQLEERILADRARARADVLDAADALSRALIVAAALAVMTVLAVGVLLRNLVNRPLSRLGDEVRAVALGAFDRPVVPSGPADLQQLGADVEGMRRALDDARTRLEEQAQELQRSNAELEQFAYVASHDLQEPLRKVASFCQILERRYGDELDDRAKQYLAFAVDGAKRMQQLINDLLMFSRVGRVTREPEELELADIVRRALDALGAAIEESGARVEIDELPRVRGDAVLLGLVFQNLIGNAVKFRRDGVAPEVAISSRPRDDGFWEIAVSDNGIGVEDQYADRIFVIFQRLHAREAYAGTGIGLAMCRKVVEHHGGELWLETGGTGDGATFRFTLPQIEEDAEHDAGA